MKMHFQNIEEIRFFNSSTISSTWKIWPNLALHHLLTNGSHCSEWVPSEWVQVIHTTQVHQLTTSEAFVKNNTIKTCLTSNHCSNLYPLCHLVWISREIFTDQAQFTVQKQFSTNMCAWRTRGRFSLPDSSRHKTLTDGLVWIIEMFYQLFGLSFWRHPFTAEQVMKEQTHLHLGWPKGEYIFS